MSKDQNPSKTLQITGPSTDALKSAAGIWCEFLQSEKRKISPHESMLVSAVILRFGINSLIKNASDLLAASLMSSKTFEVNKLCLRFRGINNLFVSGDDRASPKEADIFFAAKIAETIIGRWSSSVSYKNRSESCVASDKVLDVAASSFMDKVIPYKNQEYIQWVVSVLMDRVSLIERITVLKRTDGNFCHLMLDSLRKEVRDIIPVIDSIYKGKHNLLAVYKNLTAKFLSVDFYMRRQMGSNSTEYLLFSRTKQEFFKGPYSSQRIVVQELLRIYRENVKVAPEKQFAADLVKTWDADVIARICSERNQGSATLAEAVHSWCSSTMTAISRFGVEGSGSLHLAKLLGAHDDLTSVCRRVVVLCPLISSQKEQPCFMPAKKLALNSDSSFVQDARSGLNRSLAKSIHAVFKCRKQDRLAHIRKAFVACSAKDPSVTDLGLLQQAAMSTALSDQFLTGNRIMDAMALLEPYNRTESALTLREMSVNYPIILHSFYRVRSLCGLAEISAKSPKCEGVILIAPTFTSPLDRLREDFIRTHLCRAQSESLLSRRLSGKFFGNSQKSRMGRELLFFSMLEQVCKFYKELIDLLLTLDARKRKELIIKRKDFCRDELFSQLYAFLYFLDLSATAPKRNAAMLSVYRKEYIPTVLSLLHHVSDFYTVVEVNKTLRSFSANFYKLIGEFLKESSGTKEHYFLASTLSTLDLAGLSEIEGKAGNESFSRLAKHIFSVVYSPIWMDAYAGFLVFQAENLDSVIQKLWVFSLFIKAHIAINKDISTSYATALTKWSKVFIRMVLASLDEKLSSSQSSGIFMSLVMLYLGFSPEERAVYAHIFNEFLTHESFQSLKKSCFTPAKIRDILSASSLGLAHIPPDLAAKKEKTEAQKLRARKKKKEAKERKRQRRKEELAGSAMAREDEASRVQEGVSRQLEAVKREREKAKQEKVRQRKKEELEGLAMTGEDQAGWVREGVSRELEAVKRETEKVQQEKTRQRKKEELEGLAMTEEDEESRALEAVKHEKVSVVKEGEGLEEPPASRERAPFDASNLVDEFSPVIIEGAERVDACEVSGSNRLIVLPWFKAKRGASLSMTTHDLKNNKMATYKGDSGFLRNLAETIKELSEIHVSIFLKSMNPEIPTSDLDWLLVSRNSILTPEILSILRRHNICAPRLLLGNPFNKFYYLDIGAGENSPVKIKIDIQLLCIRGELLESEALYDYFREKSMCSVQSTLLWELRESSGELSVKSPVSVLPKGFSIAQYSTAWKEFRRGGRLYIYEEYQSNMLPNKEYVRKVISDSPSKIPNDFICKLYNLCFVFKLIFKFKQSLPYCSLYIVMFMSLYLHKNKNVAKSVHQFWYDFLIKRSVAHKSDWTDYVETLYVQIIGESVSDKGSWDLRTKFIRLTLDILKGALTRTVLGSHSGQAGFDSVSMDGVDCSPGLWGR